MQRFGGLLLMLMSTAALGSYLVLPPPADDDADLAEVTRISIAPYHQARGDGTIRTFAPASATVRNVGKPETNAALAGLPNTASTWTAVVTANRSHPAVLGSSRRSDPATRYELARDLQRELKRAGCYGGTITGVWSPATKSAMATFLDRANASLPITVPDYILLSLVQNHTEISCTADCPSGQMVGQAGRCVPSAVIAQASKRARRLEANRAMAAMDAQTDVTQPRVATAVPERLPWLDNDGRSIVTRPPPPAPRGAALPGMMSIGGPAVATSQSPQRVTVERDDGTSLNGASGSIANPNPANVASLTSEDGATDDAGFAADAGSDTLTAAEPVKQRHTKRPRNWRDRPHHYGYSGRRRGEPRPGSMRYNLVQALGGIY